MYLSQLDGMQAKTRTVIELPLADSIVPEIFKNTFSTSESFDDKKDENEPIIVQSIKYFSKSNFDKDFRFHMNFHKISNIFDAGRRDVNTGRAFSRVGVGTHKSATSLIGLFR